MVNYSCNWYHSCNCRPWTDLLAHGRVWYSVRVRWVFLRPHVLPMMMMIGIIIIITHHHHHHRHHHHREKPTLWLCANRTSLCCRQRWAPPVIPPPSTPNQDVVVVVVVVDSCYRCVSTIAPRCLVGVSAVLTHRPGGLAAAAKKAAAGKDISYVFDNVILDTTKPGMMAAMAADMQVTPPNGHHHLTCGLAIPECQRRKSLPWTQLLPPLRSFARAGALPLEPGRCCGGGGAAAQQHPAEFGDRRRCTADPDCPYQPGPHQFILGQNS